MSTVLHTNNPTEHFQMPMTSTLQNYTTAERSTSVPMELRFEIGLWLLALSSFLQTKNHIFPEGNLAKASSQEWSNEIRLVQWALTYCSELAFQFSRTQNSNSVSQNLQNDEIQLLDANQPGTESSLQDFAELSKSFNNLAVLSEGLLKSTPINFETWLAYSQIAEKELKTLAVYQSLSQRSQKLAEGSQPEVLQRLFQNSTISKSLEGELRVIFAKIGGVLSWLTVIGKMLNEDKPLKPTLLIFALIYEQTQEMLEFLNNRLRRFTNEDDEFFNVMDCNVYATSIEIRRVYTQELTDVVRLRQSPTIFAKVETAQGLLNDCFQQSMIAMVNLFAPAVEGSDIFPRYKTKLDQSMTLRNELWSVMQNTRKAEKDVEVYPLPQLHQCLLAFQRNNLRYLMYKDWETLERFVEEIVRTRDKTELVPLLHRFGAYLETLFGQVNMRTVLSNHPFEPPQS